LLRKRTVLKQSSQRYVVIPSTNCIATINIEKVGDDDWPPIQAAVQRSPTKPAAKVPVTSPEIDTANPTVYVSCTIPSTRRYQEDSRITSRMTTFYQGIADSELVDGKTTTNRHESIVCPASIWKLQPSESGGASAFCHRFLISNVLIVS
jgi:hypothetical protein